MRISTLQKYNANVGAMLDNETDIYNTQQQISTGKKILNDSDDPVLANQLKTLNELQGQLQSYQGTVTSAKNILSLEEVHLRNFSDLATQVKQLTVSALNGGLNSTNLSTIAIQMQSQMNSLLGIANTKDSDGNYLFSGSQLKTQPFVTGGGVTTYQGDINQRYLSIDTSTTVAISDSGNEIFSGKNTFTATPAASNTGSGAISTVQLNAAYTPGTYTIQFDATGTTYGITDAQGNVVVAAGTAYTSGNTISFNGMQTTITGTVGANDSYTVSKTGNIFNVIQNMITALQAGNGTAATAARFVSALTNGQSALADVTDTATQALAAVGARLNVVADTGDKLSSLTLQNGQTISTLGQTDLIATASLLSQQQVTLQAMQKAYVATSTLSLFQLL